MGFPGNALGKNSPANAGDARDSGLIFGSGGAPEAGNGNSLQYSCLRNPMDRGAWQATVHGVANSRTQLNTHTHTHTHTHTPLLFICLETLVNFREAGNLPAANIIPQMWLKQSCPSNKVF